MGLVWYVGELSPAQKIVLLALADHSNDEGKSVYPGVKRLTYKTSLSERAVRRALANLRKLGLIKIEKEATFHLPTEYSVDLPQMQAMQMKPPTGSDDLPEMHPIPSRPARSATEDLPEVPLRPATQSERPARDAPKPSLTINLNHQVKEVKEGASAPHPALPIQAQTFLNHGGKFPAGKLKDGATKKSKAVAFMVERIPEDPESLARWGTVVEKYVLTWSATSYTVMINDYFLQDRIPGQSRKNGTGPTVVQPRGLGAVQRAAEKMGISLFPNEVKHGEQ